MEIVIPLIAIAIASLLVAMIIRGAPPVPTSRKSVEKIVELASHAPHETAVDLGAGDGRVVIALASAGMRTEGYEINPLLVFLARYKIKKAGVGGVGQVYWGNFWAKDLSEFGIINVYGATHIMKGLAKKFEKELQPGTFVISNIFPIPGWRYVEKVDSIYLYIKG